VRPGSQTAPGIEVGGPTAHPGSQTTHEIEAGGPIATLRQSDHQALHNTSIAYFVDFGHDPRGTHITRGPGDHDFGRATYGTGVPALPATLLTSPSGCAGAIDTASTSASAADEGRTGSTSSQPSSVDHAGEVGLLSISQ
jgi:hypothetical protein